MAAILPRALPLAILACVLSWCGIAVTRAQGAVSNCTSECAGAAAPLNPGAGRLNPDQSLDPSEKSECWIGLDVSGQAVTDKNTTVVVCNDGALASAFCMGPTISLLVNGVAGLAGPGTMLLPGPMTISRAVCIGGAESGEPCGADRRCGFGVRCE